MLISHLYIQLFTHSLSRSSSFIYKLLHLRFCFISSISFSSLLLHSSFLDSHNSLYFFLHFLNFSSFTFFPSFFNFFFFFSNFFLPSQLFLSHQGFYSTFLFLSLFSSLDCPYHLPFQILPSFSSFCYFPYHFFNLLLKFFYSFLRPILNLLFLLIFHHF